MKNYISKLFFFKSLKSVNKFTEGAICLLYILSGTGQLNGFYRDACNADAV